MPVPNGPLLVDGPVEVVLPDGAVVRSDRPVVAICLCRRSRHYPFCDTSHRARGASPEEPVTEEPVTEEPPARREE